MSEQVRKMFADIAPRYDFANTALSLGVHHRWRKRAVELSGARERALERGDVRVLDCATGTGDLAITFQRALGERGSVTGTDFCAEMMETAPAKAHVAGVSVRFEVADVMRLPYADASFDAVSIAFGIRNADDPARGIAEMARVAKPGGTVLVLEFGQPEGWFSYPYRAYSNVLIPFVGGLLTGNREAYGYLNRTAANFPSGERFLELMRSTGAFAECRAVPLTFGVAYAYLGTVGSRQ